MFGRRRRCYYRGFTQLCSAGSRWACFLFSSLLSSARSLYKESKGCVAGIWGAVLVPFLLSRNPSRLPVNAIVFYTMYLVLKYSTPMFLPIERTSIPSYPPTSPARH